VGLAEPWLLCLCSGEVSLYSCNSAFAAPEVSKFTTSGWDSTFLGPDQ
jgi:hypothetical protein